MRVITLRKPPHKDKPWFTVAGALLLTVPPHLPPVERACPRVQTNGPVEQRGGLGIFGRVRCIVTVPMMSKKALITWQNHLTWYILTFLAAWISVDTSNKSQKYTKASAMTNEPM